MANTCMLTMYYADCTGNAKNNKYSHKIDVVDAASFVECVSHDYVCAEFSNYRRSNANFIQSNCAGFDIDNEFSDNPDNWITAEKIAQEFEPLTYAIHYSRNLALISGRQISIRASTMNTFLVAITKSPVTYGYISTLHRTIFILTNLLMSNLQLCLFLCKFYHVQGFPSVYVLLNFYTFQMV